MQKIRFQDTALQSTEDLQNTELQNTEPVHQALASIHFPMFHVKHWFLHPHTRILKIRHTSQNKRHHTTTNDAK